MAHDQGEDKSNQGKGQTRTTVKTEQSATAKIIISESKKIMSTLPRNLLEEYRNKLSAKSQKSKKFDERTVKIKHKVLHNLKKGIEKEKF